MPKNSDAGDNPFLGLHGGTPPLGMPRKLGLHFSKKTAAAPQALRHSRAWLWHPRVSVRDPMPLGQDFNSVDTEISQNTEPARPAPKTSLYRVIELVIPSVQP